MKYSSSIMIVVLVIGVLLIFAFYPSSSSSMSSEINPAYSDSVDTDSVTNDSFKPSQPFNSDGYNSIDSYAKATGIQSSIIQPPMSDNRQQSIQNPAELLPRPEGQGQWAVSTPNGQGELMNLLKAGFHAGINTIGSSNRNANLQLRSEPPNPQIYSGPWNNSTITQDAVRRPVLEIGQGPE